MPREVGRFITLLPAAMGQGGETGGYGNARAEICLREGRWMLLQDVKARREYRACGKTHRRVPFESFPREKKVRARARASTFRFCVSGSTPDRIDAATRNLRSEIPMR